MNNSKCLVTAERDLLSVRVIAKDDSRRVQYVPSFPTLETAGKRYPVRNSPDSPANTHLYIMSLTQRYSS